MYKVVVPHQDVLVRDPAPHTPLHLPLTPVLAVPLHPGRVVDHLGHHHAGDGLPQRGVPPGEALAAVGEADPEVLTEVDPLTEQTRLVEVLLQTVVEDAVEVVQPTAVKCPESSLILDRLEPAVGGPGCRGDYLVLAPKYLPHFSFKRPPKICSLGRK